MPAFPTLVRAERAMHLAIGITIDAVPREIGRQILNHARGENAGRVQATGLDEHLVKGNLRARGSVTATEWKASFAEPRGVFFFDLLAGDIGAARLLIGGKGEIEFVT